MPTRQVLTIRPEASPGRFRQALEALRSIVLGPWNPKDATIAQYFGSGGPTHSGISVTEHSALAYSAVWSAVTMIADDIASLPLHLYKRLPTGGKDRFETHPLYRLLHDAPNPEMDSMVLRRVLQAHVLLWQNAYAEIERDSSGRPIALWPLVPERVTPGRRMGQVVYRVTNEGGGDVIIPADDMIHLVGYSHDGSVGSSLVQKARESLALGLAAEQFGAAFFGNGATVGGVITHKGPRPSELADKNYREQLNARHQGVDRAHRMLVLYNDATFTKTTIPPNEGQFNETRVQQVREVARWFRMPPHKLGDLADATYSNVEQMDAAYLSSCIRPWLRLWEQQLSRKLIAKLERTQQFIEHDTHGFMSVDAAGRSALYATEFRVASVSPNEIRGYENRDPIEGGDEAFVPLDVIPLSKSGAYWDAQIAEKQAAAAPKTVPAPPTADQINSIKQAVAERDGVIETLTGHLTAAEADRATVGLKLEVAEREREALRVELASEREKRTAGEQTITELRATVTTQTTEIAGLGAALEAERATVAREQARAMANALQADEASEAKRDAEAKAAESTQRAESWQRSAVAANDQRLAAELLAEEQGSKVRDLTVECDALKIRLMTAETAAAELREQLKGHIETREALGKAEAEKQTAIEARAKADADNAEKVTEILQLQDRIVIAIQAAEQYLRDKLQGVVLREIARAKNNQTTPEKLAKWIDTFYPVHEEFCREALTPAVKAWAACVGRDDVDEALEQWIQRHLDESQHQLKLVVQESDPDAFAVALEKLLRRWETERAARTVARWVKERAA